MMMKAGAIAASAAALFAGAAASVPDVVNKLQQMGPSANHPTLSNRWTATVYEDELGWVIESYKMIDNYNESVPSAKWTNFTDHSCEELIYVVGNDEIDGRYLLKCDAIDCCKEEQDGNHVEYVRRADCSGPPPTSSPRSVLLPRSETRPPPELDLQQES